LNNNTLETLPDSIFRHTECRPETARWYAIHTRARHEKKVAGQLESKRIDTFLPLLSQIRRWSDRRKRLDLPLFSGYVFVRLYITPPLRLVVLKTPGVVSFVGFNGEASPIPDEQIATVQVLLSQDIACEPYPFVKAGQRIRIRGGALDGVEGVVIDRNADRSLVVSIDLIQRSLAVRIQGYDVEML
jgi:transcription antitermination factor NusG